MQTIPWYTLGTFQHVYEGFRRKVFEEMQIEAKRTTEHSIEQIQVKPVQQSVR